MGNGNVKSADWLSEVAKHHKKWIEITRSYNGGIYSEDIVQEMYLKLHKYTKPEKIIVNGKLNKGYVFFALKSIIVEYHRERAKIKKEDIEDHRFVSAEDDTDKKEAYERIITNIDKELKDWYWYDRDMFELYRDSGKSMRKIAAGTNISWVSIFNTLKNGKKKIKEKFGEDWEDYENGDYERI